ncbi:stage II sporulation protein P [Desulfallas sp. Bu1-1]|uniref:stage II sporulation protein P n=1 Tax=Desulfallas sp. Bu1-1 TaxID=2787620 RepID=UPI0028BE369E|nr:stage II sporulation protein P [Desulfallas sp. Bu1-1]
MKLLKMAIVTGWILLNLLVFPCLASAGGEADHVAGVTYKLVDQYGRVISLTSRKPAGGDEIIDARGYHYKVTWVEGKTARVRLMGRDKEFLAMVAYYDRVETVPVLAEQWYKRPVGIYHTHSDESYLPTDGAASIPFKGGIYQVGAMFHQGLKERKVQVRYDRTPHDPHDANAYYRSRRTALRLLKQKPVALFDVHRDGVDNPAFYRRIVSDRDVTQLRLVVGRQNPKMTANLDFAKRLMAFANKEHPGLVKEIYLARGNYNQDLLSTALLIEAGTYTNKKPEAESGVALLAGAVPTLLGLTPPAAPQPKGITSREAGHQGWKTAFLIIFLIVLAAAAFIFINNPASNVREFLIRKAKSIFDKIRN